MLDIFLPYIPFIAFFIAIMINTLLVITKAPWFSYVVANVLITIVLTSIGIDPFDVIGLVFAYIFELLTIVLGYLLSFFIAIITAIFRFIIELPGTIVDNIIEFFEPDMDSSFWQWLRNWFGDPSIPPMP
jgi:hypothetical protein